MVERGPQQPLSFRKQQVSKHGEPARPKLNCQLKSHSLCGCDNVHKRVCFTRLRSFWEQIVSVAWSAVIEKIRKRVWLTQFAVIKGWGKLGIVITFPYSCLPNWLLTLSHLKSMNITPGWRNATVCLLAQQRQHIYSKPNIKFESCIFLIWRNEEHEYRW